MDLLKYQPTVNQSKTFEIRTFAKGELIMTNLREVDECGFCIIGGDEHFIVKSKSREIKHPKTQKKTQVQLPPIEIKDVPNLTRAFKIAEEELEKIFKHLSNPLIIADRLPPGME